MGYSEGVDHCGELPRPYRAPRRDIPGTGKRHAGHKHATHRAPGRDTPDTGSDTPGREADTGCYGARSSDSPTWPRGGNVTITLLYEESHTIY